MVQNDGSDAPKRVGRSTGENAKVELKRRSGLFIVEVARATLDGLLPINQIGIRKSLKANHRLDLAPSQSTHIVSILIEEYFGKKWLRTEGHRVYLNSEETTLVDAAAIRALFLAKELVDGDDQLSSDEWIATCEKKLNCSTTDCETYLSDFVSCGYVHEDPKKENKTLRLDLRAIGEDDFYLQQAAKAGLKKRVPRTKRPR